MMCSLIKPATFAVLLVAIIFSMQKEFQESDDPKKDVLLISICIVVLMFTISLYGTISKSSSNIMGNDTATVLRVACTACFTTDLFVKNDVLGDAWNYIPLVIAIVVCFIFLLQGGESACDRSFLSLFLIANLVAQLYVACKIGSLLYFIASVSLVAASCLSGGGCDAEEDSGALGLSPSIWYNIMAATYCVTCNGQGIALDGGGGK